MRPSFSNHQSQVNVNPNKNVTGNQRQSNQMQLNMNHNASSFQASANLFNSMSQTMNDDNFSHAFTNTAYQNFEQKILNRDNFDNFGCFSGTSSSNSNSNMNVDYLQNLQQTQLNNSSPFPHNFSQQFYIMQLQQRLNQLHVTLSLCMIDIS